MTNCSNNKTDVEVMTGGGSYIDGEISAGQNVIGRDNYEVHGNIHIHNRDIEPNFTPLDNQPVHVWRKHWFILLIQISIPTLLGLSCILLIMFSSLYRDLEFFRILIILTLASCLLTNALIGWLWHLGWCNDAYELESSQFIEIKRDPLTCSEERSFASLDQIKDLRVNFSSPIHRLLNFGYVRFRTVESKNDFILANVPDPRTVAETLRRCIDAYHSNRRSK